MRFHEFRKNPIVETLLDEVAMSPSSLAKWANSPEAEGILMGVEYEMYVPDVSNAEEYDSFSEQDIKKYKQMFAVWKIDSIHEYVDRRIKYELKDYIREVVVNEFDYDSADKEAKKALGKKASDEEIGDYVSDMIADKVKEVLSMDKVDNPEYASYVESASNIMEDEAKEHFDSATESDWLESIGIDKMSDVSEDWGYTWPWWRSTKNDGTRSIDDIARIFKEDMGISKLNVGAGWHTAERERGSWIIERDGSLDRPNDMDDAGLEFIAPEVPVAKAIDTIQKVQSWARQNRCYTNATCGLHMNVSVPNYSLENLDYVKLAIFLGDNYILDQFRRKGNDFAKSVSDLIVLKTNFVDVEKVFAKMRSSLSKEASRLIHAGNRARQSSINAKDGWVEFRGPGGDWINESPDKLVNTILRCGIALKIATNENAYREEYAKKLYKLLSPQGEVNDATQLFSLYSTGQLDTKTLAMRLEKLRAQRKTKPTVAPSTEPKTYKVFKHDGSLMGTISALNDEQIRHFLVHNGRNPDDYYWQIDTDPDNIRI